jgi:hypothetical protein
VFDVCITKKRRTYSTRSYTHSLMIPQNPNKKAVKLNARLCNLVKDLLKVKSLVFLYERVPCLILVSVPYDFMFPIPQVLNNFCASRLQALGKIRHLIAMPAQYVQHAKELFLDGWVWCVEDALPAISTESWPSSKFVTDLCPRPRGPPSCCLATNLGRPFLCTRACNTSTMAGKGARHRHRTVVSACPRS